MTLDELINGLVRLREAAPEAGAMEVETEGCDCWGEIDKIEIRSDGVLLVRPEH